LVWSVEHNAWWRPDGNGYTRRLSQAGRYDYRVALSICAKAVPGTSSDIGALPELPVRAADAEEIRNRFRTEFPRLPLHPWE
jgi:hypothetical protein